jgi:hypothetical protein
MKIIITESQKNKFSGNFYEKWGIYIIMKRIIKLTESDLTRIVKRVIKESGIIKRDNGDIILGMDSILGGGRPGVMTKLDFAKQQLQIVIVLMNYLPSKLPQDEIRDLKKLYNSYIDNAISHVRNNEEFLEELLPMCKKLETLINKTLNDKSDNQIES